MECWRGGCGLTGIVGEIDQPACTDSDPRSKCPIDLIIYSLKETKAGPQIKHFVKKNPPKPKQIPPQPSKDQM